VRLRSTWLSLIPELNSTSEHHLPWTLLTLFISFKSTLSWWLSWSLATFIYGWVLGLRGLCSQLGTAGRSVVPSLSVIAKTWPCNWVVFSRILVFFVTNFIQPYFHQFFNNFHGLNSYEKPSKRPFDWC